MRKITSDYIHTGNQGIVTDKYIVLDEQGMILDVLPIIESDRNQYEYYPGLLIPGFVNAHCHLELSHLKGKFATGTRLIPFLKSVVEQRNFPMDFILQSIEAADLEMQQEGIVAVGDISNKTDTIETKKRSPIHYHTFIEAFDFLQDPQAAHFFAGYKTVYDSYSELHKSMVPHAPYSVSPSLFKLINEVNGEDALVISMHNMETMDEDQMFINRSGGFIEFWQSFGFNMDAFEAINKESIYYAMQHLPTSSQLLLIHNTQMKEAHILDVLQWNANTYFVTCPNANLFIENALPDYRHFINTNASMCIGTDSLSSNWHLSILEEIKTINKYNSWLSLEDLFTWATYNGAKALKVEHQYGSITKSKKPGINWIQEFSKENDRYYLKPDAGVQKII